MRARKFAFAIAAAAPLVACADDETVAVLAEIDGSVLVSTGSEIASATRSIRLAAGMRVLTTANASAVVVFDDGCRVRVDAGERYVVAKDGPCRPTATVDASRQAAEASR